MDSDPWRLPCLDVAELNDDGARAILLPDTSIFSSQFLGVNKAFCDFFRYNSCEFQSSPFTKLVGTTTNTKQLQAMWQGAVRGSEESFEIDLYDKSGALKTVHVDLLPRTLRGKPTTSQYLDGIVVVARIRESLSSSLSNPGAVISEKVVAGLRHAAHRIRTSLVNDEWHSADVFEHETAMLAQPATQVRHTDDLSCDHGTDSRSNALPESKDCLRPNCRPQVSAPGDRSPISVPQSRRASCALRLAFPRAIAEAIMCGRRPEPIVRDCVSVFFSDIVGFTKFSSTAEASQVSGLLTRLFAKFDALAQLHGVQKIDVIGDAYLAATNVLEDQAADHAARLARFAMDAVAAAAATRLDDADPASPAVQIRVGLHSGPASATVVGAQGYKYTLFGDTVNTASRMESTSLPGRIQCSAAAAALIADQDPLVPLMAREGGVEAKGKGLMRTCWVGRSAGQPVAAPSGTSIAAAEPGVRGAAAARSVGGFISFMRGRRAPPPGGGLAVF